MWWVRERKDFFGSHRSIYRPFLLRSISFPTKTSTIKLWAFALTPSLSSFKFRLSSFFLSFCLSVCLSVFLSVSLFFFHSGSGTNLSGGDQTQIQLDQLAWMLFNNDVVHRQSNACKRADYAQKYYIYCLHLELKSYSFKFKTKIHKPEPPSIGYS